MTASATSRGQVYFQDPPVNEVVFSICFEPLPLPLTVYGELAASYRALYPNCINGQNPGSIWLKSANEDTVLQFEAFRFTRNWRRQAESVYPGHSELFRLFSEDWDSAVRFLQAQGLPAIQPRGVE